MNIAPPTSSTSRSNVALSAFWESRLIADTNIPAASEINNALTSAKTVLQNCAPVTPPISKVTARIGNTASSAQIARSDVAISFPNGAGTAFEGVYRYASSRFDIGFRGGMWDPGACCKTELLVGAEARERVITHTVDFPLDGALVFGLGGAFVSGGSVAFIPVKVVLNVRDCPASPRHVHDTLPSSGSTITVSSCFVLSRAAEAADVGEVREVGTGAVEDVGVAGCTITVRVQPMEPRSAARTIMRFDKAMPDCALPHRAGPGRLGWMKETSRRYLGHHERVEDPSRSTR